MAQNLMVCLSRKLFKVRPRTVVLVGVVCTLCLWYQQFKSLHETTIPLGDVPLAGHNFYAGKYHHDLIHNRQIRLQSRANYRQARHRKGHLHRLTVSDKMINRKRGSMPQYQPRHYIASDPRDAESQSRFREGMTNERSAPKADAPDIVQSVNNTMTQSNLSLDFSSEFFKPRKAKQVFLDYGYIHDARNTCLGDDFKLGGLSPDVVILVLTTAGQTNTRNAIRNTYGSVARGQPWPASQKHGDFDRTGRVRVVFLLGQKRRSVHNLEIYEAKYKKRVEAESLTHGDIVQWEGLAEAYFNLTLKVLLGIRWVKEFCPLARYVLKTDEDTFVHLPRLFRHLDDVNAGSLPDVIHGLVYPNSSVLLKGKYAVAKGAYPFDVYPPYTQGNIYLMTSQLAFRILHVAPYMPYNNMEDTHVTGTLAHVVGARHLSFNISQYTPDRAAKPCDFVRQKDRLVTVNNNARTFHMTWKRIRQPDLCLQPTR